MPLVEMEREGPQDPLLAHVANQPFPLRQEGGMKSTYPATTTAANFVLSGLDIGSHGDVCVGTVAELTVPSRFIFQDVGSAGCSGTEE